MGGMQVGGKRLGIGASMGRMLLATRLGLPAVLLIGLVLALPGVASAESLCTDTWVGPTEGTWQTVADWSLGTVPTSTDVGCIGSGKTVKVTEGATQAGVVQGEGKLVVSGGSLEVANALEPSTISGFTQSGGTLLGAGTLNVSGSFTWSGGTGSTSAGPST